MSSESNGGRKLDWFPIACGVCGVWAILTMFIAAFGWMGLVAAGPFVGFILIAMVAFS